MTEQDLVRDDPAEDEDPGAGRIVTVPNFISVGRILLVPAFVWAVVTERSPYGINVILCTIGVTDFLDGWIARRFHQVTRLGALLDPIGDRLAIGTALVIFLWKGWIPWWLGAALVFREVAVSVGALILGALGVQRFDVTFIGKLATLLLMFGVPFFTIAASDYNWNVPARVVAYSLAIPGLFFSYLAVWQYVTMTRDSWPNRGVASKT